MNCVSTNTYMIYVYVLAYSQMKVNHTGDIEPKLGLYCLCMYIYIYDKLIIRFLPAVHSFRVVLHSMQETWMKMLPLVSKRRQLTFQDTVGEFCFYIYLYVNVLVSSCMKAMNQYIYIYVILVSTWKYVYFHIYILKS